MSEITVPFSKEAEEALIGYVLIDPERFDSIDIRAEDFYIHRHRTIWSTIASMRARNIGVDLISLCDELDKSGGLLEIGGAAYVTGFGDTYPLGFDSESSAKIVKENAQRRGLIALAGRIAKVAHDQKENLEVRSGEFIEQLTNLTRVVGGAVHWRKYLTELYDDIEARSKNPREVWGIPTGFARLDRITGGFQQSESLILSGKPGVGKSILAMQWAEQMAASYPGAIYSVEMKGISVVRRILSARSEIPAYALKSGRLADDDYSKIAHWMEKLEALPIQMSDASGWSTTSLRADLARLKAQHHIRWFVFDYMMLADDGAGMNETERTTLISRNMKQICRSLDLAGIIIHSMNKLGMGVAEPDQSNLRGSGQISYDADLILFLTDFQAISTEDGFIPRNYHSNMRTLFFGKGRELQDPCKYIHLVKRPTFPIFADYMPEAKP